MRYNTPSRRLQKSIFAYLLLWAEYWIFLGVASTSNHWLSNTPLLNRFPNDQLFCIRNFGFLPVLLCTSKNSSRFLSILLLSFVFCRAYMVLHRIIRRLYFGWLAKSTIRLKEIFYVSLDQRRPKRSQCFIATKVFALQFIVTLSICMHSKHNFANFLHFVLLYLAECVNVHLFKFVFIKTFETGK